MRARLEPLPAPVGGRYFAVDMTALRDAEVKRIEQKIAEVAARLPAAPPTEEGPPSAEVTEALEALKVLRLLCGAVAARPARGEHTFCLPLPSRIPAIGALRDALGEARRETWYALLGCCWHHRALELEATWPLVPSPEALVAYAEAVQCELLDYGYSELELQALGLRVLQAVGHRQIDGAAAREVADFTFGPRASGSSGPVQQG
jgi:hypothetical protein